MKITFWKLLDYFSLAVNGFLCILFVLQHDYILSLLYLAITGMVWMGMMNRWEES